MGRASQAQAAQHRLDILEVAAKLLKQDGVGGVSIPEIMSGAGLTHGGFYRHFDSKEELTGAAVNLAFEKQRDFLGRLNETNPGDHPAGIAALTEFYLSDRHRDDRGSGCPIAALGADVARSEAASPVRAEFTSGVKKSVDILAGLGDDDSLDAEQSARQRADALSTLAMLVGANIIARATAGDPISEEIMDAARRQILAAVPAAPQVPGLAD